MPKNSHEGEIIAGLLTDAEGAIAQGALAKASAVYRGILTLDPDHVVALRQLAALAIEFGDPRAAAELFRHAVAQDPRDPDLYHGVGTALRLLGQEAEALLAYEGALRADPRHAPALHDRAKLLETRGDLKGAAEFYKRLADAHNSHFGALFNRAVVLFHQDNLLAAERWFHAAAQVDPKDPRPLINLAMIYRIWGYLPQALGCLEHAVQLAPDLPETQWNLANARLVTGDFVQGFAGYEWRFRRAEFTDRAFSPPRWQGEDLAGRTLLITAEQGLGDAIHFVRFAAPLAARGAKVIVEAPVGLDRLFATVPGVAGVTPWGHVPEGVDFVLPMLSAAHMLGTTLETLPARTPYMSVPDGTKVPPIRGEGLKVGVVWRGNPMHDNDRHRSVPLTLLSPLADVPGISWYGLQTENGLDEPKGTPFESRMTMLRPYLTDFAITAAAMEKLDLIISVDTASAHLAGALNKPVWTLLPQGNDWRWLHGRDDSPWYPSMRLFRQRHPRNWGPTVAEMTEALRTRAGSVTLPT